MRLFVIAVCLLLVGCSAKSENISVHIANQGNGLQIQSLPVVLALQLGYYKEEGLDVQLENLASAAKSLQALVGGSVDAASISYPQNIQIAAEGQHVRTFFIGIKRTGNVMVVAPAAMSRIHSAEDLKGSLLGVMSPGSGTHFWANHYLAAHGVHPTDFQTIGIGIGASGIAAIESGRVDAAALTGGDHFYLLKRHPDLRILVDASTPEGMRESIGGDAYGSGALAARQEWLDRNPETARKLCRALVRTLQWIAAHSPEQVRERLPESFRTADAALDVAILRWGLAAFTTDGRMPKDAPQNLKRYLDETVESVRTAKIDLATTWTNEYLPEPK